MIYMYYHLHWWDSKYSHNHVYLVQWFVQAEDYKKQWPVTLEHYLWKGSLQTRLSLIIINLASIANIIIMTVQYSQ